MHTAESITNDIIKILGYVPSKFDPEEVASDMNHRQREKRIELTVYGLFMWCVDKYGEKALFGNVLSNTGNIASYADAAVAIRDDFPVLLLNAGEYVRLTMSKIPDVSTCVEKVVGMSFPHVVYVLFAGGGQQMYVQDLKPQFDEMLQKYPSALDRLPGAYRGVGGAS
jgi:hypothetical protein